MTDPRIIITNYTDLVLDLRPHANTRRGIRESYKHTEPRNTIEMRNKSVMH